MDLVSWRVSSAPVLRGSRHWGWVVEGLPGEDAFHGMHVGAGSVSSCQKCHSLTFALDLGLPIPRLAGREAGREQHQPHLCGDEKPLWALQGTPGWREGNRCANPGGHADPKLDGGLECGARGINSPTLCVGRATGGGEL